MTQRFIGWSALALMVVASGTVANGSVRSSTGVAYGLDAAVASAADAAQAKGRYKKEGDNCVWDSNDTGPNQCTPVTTGRFKRTGGSCVWVANEKGRDQCTPKTGRFKKEGDQCVWSATDSGPNQCNPRQPK
jgi:hypothetical protein